MGLDVDYVFGKNAIENIEKLLSDTPHGERGEVVDDIMEFHDKMCEKYNHPTVFKKSNEDLDD